MREISKIENDSSLLKCVIVNIERGGQVGQDFALF